MGSVNSAVSAQSKGPPTVVVGGGNDVTLEVVEPYRVQVVAEGGFTLPSNTSKAETNDSTLIRIRDGQTVQVLDPQRGLLPEHRYRLPLSGDGELGKGGIGQVHLVFDNVLGREVALKVLRDEFRDENASSNSSTSSEAAWRFMREARVTGQLEHPNIVPVYELGRRADGSLYYTMRAVRGRTLGEAIRSSETLIDRLGLLHHFADVCQAIGYAHSRGVLHRDIKPENIMIGEYGETFVLDWGLARIQSRPNAGSPTGGLSLPPDVRAREGKANELDDSQHTALGRVVGTPHYMSPEQITTPSEALDSRSDVWSLGVVLYTILTGRRPFQGQTVAEILSNVLAQSPERPSEVELLVPPELEAIALRALDRDKSRRYRDAGEMARDIVAFQSGAKVGAYAYGSMELLRRFARQHRQAVVVAALAGLVLMLMAVSSYVRVRRARDNAVMAEQRAVAGQNLANLRYADVLVEKARNAAAVDDVIAARIYAAEALGVADRPEARGLLLGLSNAVDLSPVDSIPLPNTCEAAIAGTENSDLVCSTRLGLTYLRDGAPLWFAGVTEPKLIANLGPAASLVIASDRRWSAVENSTGKLRAAGESPLPAPTVLAGAPDGRWMASADVEGNVVVWQPEASSAMHRLKWNQAVTALAFTRNSGALIIGGSYGRLESWAYQTEEKAKSVGEAHTTVGSLVVGPHDSLAVVGGSDGTVSIWDLGKQKLLGTVLKHDSPISALAMSPNGRWLATSTRAEQVDLIDMQQRARVFSVPQARGPMRPLGFDQQGKLWLLHKSSELLGFEINEPKPKARMLARSNVLSLAWSPASEFMYAGGLRESGVCVFRLSDGECIDRIPVNTPYLRVTAVSPDGRYLVFAGAGKSLEVWDAKVRIPVTITDVPVEDVRAIVFDANGHAWLAGNAPFALELELPGGKVISRFAVDGPVQSMAILQRERMLLVGLRDGRLQLREWDGQVIREAKVHSDWVTGVDVIGATKTAVSVGADGNTVFWRVPSLEALTERRDHPGRATALAVSSDGALVATAGEDPVVVVSETQPPWQVKLRLHDHHGTVRCLAFEANSRRLASGGDDAMVRLWNLQSLDVDVTALRAQVAMSWHLNLDGSSLVPETVRTQR